MKNVTGMVPAKVRTSFARHVAYGWMAVAWWAYVGATCAAPPASGALGPPGARAPAASDAELDVGGWIERMHTASRSRSYSGTFVVLSSTGAMASSRIWHACDGKDLIERVDALSGTPRTVFRRNGEVRTFLPESRVVRLEQRDVPGLFPQLPAVDGAMLSKHYAAQLLGRERVAGFEADVVWFRPLDAWRFGYRVWTERSSGMVIKLQTVDGAGNVLEQAAFSELDLDAPVRMEQVARLMNEVEGYRVVVVPTARTTAAAEGWRLREPLPGFVPLACYKWDGAADGGKHRPLQCVYSDGLATVSMFMEPYRADHHPPGPRHISMGATQTWGVRVLDDTWVTVVGEVPLNTLRRLAETLERTR